MYLPAINYARRRGIEFLTIPPHTSHRLQPLDRTFFGPLKTFYSQEANKWMVSHPGRRITEFKITKRFRAACERAATMQNSVSGFQSTGILPFNPNIFGDSDFAPASVTEIKVEINEIQEKDKFTNVSTNNNVELANLLPQISSSVATTSTSRKDSNSTVDECNELACPDASKQNDEDQRVFPSFSDVSPLPTTKLTHKKRRAKQAAHITGSPFKKSITAKVGGTALKKLKYVKNPEAINKVNKNNKTKYTCLLFAQPYEEPPTEDRIQCAKCLQWCHDRCSDYSGQGFFVSCLIFSDITLSV